MPQSQHRARFDRRRRDPLGIATPGLACVYDARCDTGVAPTMVLIRFTSPPIVPLNPLDFTQRTIGDPPIDITQQSDTYFTLEFGTDTPLDESLVFNAVWTKFGPNILAAPTTIFINSP